MGLPLLSLIFLSLGFIFFPLLVQSQQPQSHPSTPPPPPFRGPTAPKSQTNPEHSNLPPKSNHSDHPEPKSPTEPGHSNLRPPSNSPRRPQRQNYNRNSQENKQPPSKYSKQRKHSNLGEKVGFFFVGAAAFLQVCMVTFLLLRRRQLMKVVEERFTFRWNSSILVPFLDGEDLHLVLFSAT